MLIQFSFRNFRSFRDEITVDMTASDIEEHKYNLINGNDDNKYLKTAAIYGANASGKSNIIKAFEFMQQFVCNSFAQRGPEFRFNKKMIPIKGFYLDKNSRDDTSEFEVFFVQDNTEYQYGFLLDRQMIHKEWLYFKNKENSQYEILFERFENELNFGEKLKDCDKFIDAVEEQTLFITLLAKLKIKAPLEVYKWFTDNIVIDFGDAFYENLLTKMIPGEKLMNDDYRKKFEDFLQAIDTGIKGLRVEEIKSGDGDNNEAGYRIFTLHQPEEISGIHEIEFGDESSGTQKMFFLFEYFMEAIEAGSVMFIDELDAKLHPLLLRYIINIFQKSESNRNNAQLIYTTHDMYTLTRDIFRRDQIWFTEKDNNGVSSLFSLLEYKPDSQNSNASTSLNKDYVTGRYGAIPLLREFNILEDN